jgi:hypothetical protein
MRMEAGSSAQTVIQIMAGAKQDCTLTVSCRVNRKHALRNMDSGSLGRWRN